MNLLELIDRRKEVVTTLCAPKEILFDELGKRF